MHFSSQMTSDSIPYDCYQILAACALCCKQYQVVIQLENCLSFVKCTVHNLHILIYYYIPLNESQPVWCAYANLLMPLVQISMMWVLSVWMPLVSMLMLWMSLLHYYYRCIGIDEKLHWIGDARFNKIASYVAKCQGNEIEQWRGITRSLRIAIIIKWLTGINSN